MYRLLNALALPPFEDNQPRSLPVGTYVPDGYFQPDELSRYLEVGAIEKCTDYLGEQRGWKDRAQRLEEHGIFTVRDFLKRHEFYLAQYLDTTEDQVLRWKAKLAGQPDPEPMKEATHGEANESAVDG